MDRLKMFKREEGFIYPIIFLYLSIILFSEYSVGAYGLMSLEDLRKYYDYDRAMPLNVSEEVFEEKEDYKIVKVYFDSVNGERVPSLLLLPKGEKKAPCIVFLHGYGGSKEDILEVASLVAREGYALIAIDAVYHGERKVPGKELYSPDISESMSGIIQTVIDLRRAVDYLETRLDIDAERIGYVGGSMGGIIGAIFIGVEPRIKAAALIVAGGNMSLMIRESQHYTMPAIREHLQREGISYEELQRILDPIDPINFIKYFSPRPLVFHLGKFDRIVPAEAGRQLYEAAGEPKQVYWYDAEHSLPMDLVAARILDFMDRNLLGKPFAYRENLYWIRKYAPPLGVLISVLLILFYLFRRKLRRH
ncbi:MAG: alpha/beta fold hydrolase [Candidatus Bathyarchaeota archaeon]|nr:alpha/beta fold hydrolase [Candidatus Bathyarchaeota archaeon]